MGEAHEIATDGERDPEMERFLEGIGLIFEDGGLPRMAGRIFAYLLVCEPPEQSATDLARAVPASKGSISTMMRLLGHTGLVERLTRPGQRGTYYRVRTGALSQLLRAHMAQVTAFRELADHGLSLLAGRSAESRRRLQDLRDLYAFLEREMPMLIARFEAERKGG